MTNKSSFLAICLYEAIDDKSFLSIKSLVEEHKANPNHIIPDRHINAFHFIVGNEDQNFAEIVTRFFLRNGGDPNLPSECENKLTPLHIACIWGYEKIVKLLLEYEGDLNIKCGEGKTPILYAIHENHYEVIDVIKKFIFEQKIEKKKKNLLTEETPYSPSQPLKTPFKHNVIQALQNLEEKKFTPNRINYNFDVTSPYYINITHRRFKSSRSSRLERSDATFVINSRSSEYSDDTETQKNLFELTERNLHEFSKKLAQTIIDDPHTMSKRKSYISDWRNKIQQIRDNQNNLDRNYLNYLNSCNNVTIIEDYPEDEEEVEEDDVVVVEDELEETFITAQSENNQEKYEKERNFDSDNQTKIFTEICEEYLHSDNENGIIFLEKKILSESKANLHKIKEIIEVEDTVSQSSLSTRITMPPLDYDTDVLRAELTTFGEAPGPITKSTKFLYLKQLVKYKKDPERMNQQKMMKSGCEKVYSVELQRTITNFPYLEQSLPVFHDLEKQMTEYFTKKPNVKWREGHLKTSFIYLLIDPRVSDNLPMQHKNVEAPEVWKKFLDSIFYVGKGKRSRPYAHLYDAIKLYSLENNKLAEKLDGRKNQIVEKCVLYSNDFDKTEIATYTKKQTSKYEGKFQESKKLNKIIEIWKSGMGVVCLHVFNNIMPVDAMTREAAIIDSIGLNNLTNLKRGDYYGLASTWKMRTRKQMGSGLLHKAMNVYLAEGESQLMPFDLI